MLTTAQIEAILEACECEELELVSDLVEKAATELKAMRERLVPGRTLSDVLSLAVSRGDECQPALCRYFLEGTIP